MPSQEMDAFIVRHLQDIESASRRINDDIQKNIGDAINSIVGEWSREKDWDSFGKFDVNDEGDLLTLAPKKWRFPDSDAKDNEFFGWFWFDAFDDAENERNWTNQFWLTQLCGLGVGPIGICWGGVPVNFNSTRGRWKQFLAPHIPSIKERGFNYQKDGIFFLPFTIDQKTLADAIEGDNIEDALGPLRNALAIIESAEPDFDTLIEDARTLFKSQK